MQPRQTVQEYSPKVIQDACTTVRNHLGFRESSGPELRQEIGKKFGVDDLTASAIYDLLWPEASQGNR